MGFIVLKNHGFRSERAMGNIVLGVCFLLVGLIFQTTLAASVGEAQKLIKRLPEHSDQRYHHPDVSPDGSKVAFSVSSSKGNKSTVWVYERRMNEMLQLTLPDSSMKAGDVQVTWSPDSRFVGFLSDRRDETHLYVVSAEGGSFRRLTKAEINSGQSIWKCRFSWSPDGNYLIYNDEKQGNSDLYKIRVDDGEIERITTDPAMEYQPDWSPDGSSVVYVGDHTGNLELWTLDLKTQIRRQVETNTTDMYFPDWSPDGEWIAFQKWGTRGYESYIVRAEGGEIVNVGPGDDYGTWGVSWDASSNGLVYHAQKRHPQQFMILNVETGVEESLIEEFWPVGLRWGTWSNHGHKFAFKQVVEIEPDVLDTALYVADLEKKAIRRLAPTSLGISNWLKLHKPVWGEGDGSIIHTVNSDGYTQLAELGLESSSPRILTKTRLPKSDITRSPDGEFIAYIAKGDGGEEIWLYDMVIDEDVQLTFSGGEKYFLDFSMDGSYIAFAGAVYGNAFNIFTVPTDGGEIVQRSDNPGWDLFPRWIDDQRFYFSAGTENRSVALVDILQNTLTDLKAIPDTDMHLPYLAPDNETLYYLSSFRQEPTLSRIQLENDAKSELIANNVTYPIFSNDGVRAAFSRSDAAEPSTIWRQDVSETTMPQGLP